MYLLCGFTVVGSSRYRHQGRPVVQKHLPLTHITPDPERCQVHSQVVLLGLKETHSQSFKGLIFPLITIHQGCKIKTKSWQREGVLPVRAGCCDQRRTLHNRHKGSHSTEQKHCQTGSYFFYLAKTLHHNIYLSIYLNWLNL